MRSILLAAGAMPLAFCLAALATRESTATPSKDAAAIARLLEAHYRSAATLQAAFLERYSQGARDIRVESGTAYFRRPGRMRWEYEEPEKKLFVSDGKTVWFYVPADKTVTRAKFKESADWRTPIALLTGKADLNRLCGQLELLKTPDQLRSSASPGAPPPSLVTLRCLPKVKAPSKPAPKGGGEADVLLEGAPFDEILLVVNRETGDLSDVVIRQSGGIELEFRFGNWRRDLPLADSMFHFVAPIGVAIVEEAKDSARHQ